MSYADNKPTIIAVPKESHPLVQKLYDDIVVLSKERNDLMAEYLQARSDLEQKFAARSESLIERINARKLKGSEEICKACGVTYDANSGYSVDAQYLELGHAYLISMERDDGARFDGMPSDLPPKGTMLN